MKSTKNVTLVENVESDLTESRQDIFAHAYEYVACIGSQGCYLSVNAAYAAVLGYSQNEMVEMFWHDTAYQDDLKISERTYQRLLNNGRSEGEVRGIR